MTNVLDDLTQEVIALLSPVTHGLRNPRSLQDLLARIGLPDDSDMTPLTTKLAQISELENQCKDLVEEDGLSFESVKALLTVLRSAFTLISTLEDLGGPIAGLPNLGKDLADLLASHWLADRHPTLYTVLIALGVVEPAGYLDFRPERTSNGQVVRSPYRLDRFHFDRLAGTVHDPVSVLKAQYGQAFENVAGAAAVADKIFPILQALLAQFGVTSRYGIHDDDAARLEEWAGPMAQALIVYTDNLLEGAAAEAGVVLMLSPAGQGDLGLVIAPFGALNFSRSLGKWTLASQASAGVDLITWGRHGITLATASNATGFDASITSTLASTNDQPASIIGSPNSTRLEIGGARLGLETHLSQTRQSVAITADVSKSTIVISPGDGDGFLSSILPAEGLRANFDLGIGFSTEKGVTLRGSAGLETTIAVGLSVAGVTLSTLYVALRAGDSALGAEISATLAASIGPVKATVDRVGLSTKLGFAPTGGNLGGADLALGFKPPSGVGVSIDAHGVFTGGGYLNHDPVTGTYAGALQVSLHDEITLTGYGLIATRMPDGSRGYSILVFITAEGFKGIPLGFGLTLQSIGGMLGIHRTFDVDVIRAGLKTGNLATLLFPRDPVSNAPALMQALAASFPVRRDSFLLGLLARITWFTPTLVQMDLALILELGSRTRLLALGRVSALLPSRDNDLIRLNLDTIGVLDFDAGTFEADAVLIDSRIAHQFPVTGSAAVRARWPVGSGASGNSANFILAVGGVNPRFAPPDGFPQLERVAIALCSGKNPRLVCDAYFAVTSNTVQFGARVSLYAEAYGFSVSGDLGFDALVTLLPPHFIIDFHASVQLKRGSHNLFKVTLDGTLEGPLPLRMAARAKFEILWISFSVHFDFTLASGNAGQTSIPTVALDAELKKAIADPANWSTRRATNQSHGVAMRALPPMSGPVLDPLGQMVMQQQLVPLNTDREISTYGGSRVAGAHRFVLEAKLNDQAAKPVTSSFAPTRYFKMSDDDKLVAPSFETMDSGFVLGDEAIKFDPSTIVSAPLEYEEIVLNVTDTLPAGAPPPAPVTQPLPLQALQEQRPSGAAGRAPVRRLGRARFRTDDVEPAARLKTANWRVVPFSGAPVAPALSAQFASVGAVDTGDATWSECQATLPTLNRSGDRWLIVPAYELAA